MMIVSQGRTVSFETTTSPFAHQSRSLIIVVHVLDSQPVARTSSFAKIAGRAFRNGLGFLFRLDGVSVAHDVRC